MGFHFVTSFAAAAFNATALSKSSPILRIADNKFKLQNRREGPNADIQSQVEQ
jgi:hypothetical protein